MAQFSIVIPIYNEEKNIPTLIKEITDIKEIKNFYELIFVNDSSTDRSLELLKDFNKNESIKIINNTSNLGQSLSINRGILKSRYDIIITMDGDLQNDPNDIPKIYNLFKDNYDYKLIAGIRSERKDSFAKKFASKIANLVRMIYLKDSCKDTGCSLKIFDKKIFLKFEFFDGIHRFIPSLFEGYGYPVKYIPVNHRKRIHGISKYNNLRRLFKTIPDMFKVKKMIKQNNKKKWDNI